MIYFLNSQKNMDKTAMIFKTLRRKAKIEQHQEKF
jgi:hypothetical protein